MISFGISPFLVFVFDPCWYLMKTIKITRFFQTMVIKQSISVSGVKQKINIANKHAPHLQLWKNSMFSILQKGSAGSFVYFHRPDTLPGANSL